MSYDLRIIDHDEPRLDPVRFQTTAEAVSAGKRRGRAFSIWHKPAIGEPTRPRHICTWRPKA